MEIDTMADSSKIDWEGMVIEGRYVRFWVGIGVKDKSKKEVIRIETELVWDGISVR